MIKTLKIIAAELKRANDLKERDIKNKETWGWYTRPNVSSINRTSSGQNDRCYTTQIGQNAYDR